MIPILGNLEFESGLQNPQFFQLVSGGLINLWDFLGSDGKLSFAALASSADPPLDFWSGLHLRHFLCQCSHIPGISHQLTELECLCHKRELIHHSLSIIYAALTRPAPDFYPTFLSWWESDLAMQFTDSVSVGTVVQEVCYCPDHHVKKGVKRLKHKKNEDTTCNNSTL